MLSVAMMTIYTEIKMWKKLSDETPKDYITDEQIELAKNSEYGGLVYTPVGPIGVTKDGEIGWYGSKCPSIKEKLRE